MAIEPSFIPIGDTGEFLDSVQVDTPAGTGLHRETVVFADPENPAGLARVTNAPPATDAYGGVVRVAGQVNTGLTQPTTPADTQPVSAASLPLPAGAATAAKQLPDNHQVQVSNFPDSQPVADDYATGEILADQTGPGVLTFTFSFPVVALWVYAVDPTDIAAGGEIRVNPFGGTPSNSIGMPVPLGAAFPLTVTTSSVRVYAEDGIRVSVTGYRRG